MSDLPRLEISRRGVLAGTAMLSASPAIPARTVTAAAGVQPDSRRGLMNTPDVANVSEASTPRMSPREVRLSVMFQTLDSSRIRSQIAFCP